MFFSKFLRSGNRKHIRTSMKKTIDIIPFCYRQFDDPNYTGSKIPYSKEEFVVKVNEYFQANPQLSPGYADFCKHVFIPNFTDAKVGALEITKDNEHLLRSGYAKRTEKELAVLERWFPRESIEDIPKAEYLDIILYSREQIELESKAMNEEFPFAKEDQSEVQWGIVSVKAQNENFELPMNPITMLRNALGKEQGGSGVPLVTELYNNSVQYWSTHATIK